MENTVAEPTTQKPEEKPTEKPNPQQEENYEEEDDYYDDDQNLEDQEEDEEGDAYDFSIENRPMKTKKFKKQKSKEVEVDEYEEEGEIEEIGTDGKKNRVFKGADKIYNQILWDDKLNKNDFIIGYVDRFEGVLEEPFSTFEILKEDIPYHRIRYFKKGNEVVWERKKKVNKL